MTKKTKTNQEKNYVLVESPVFIDKDGVTRYPVDIITNTQDTRVTGKPFNSLHITHKSKISYEDGYKQILIALLDKVDQDKFTTLLSDNKNK